MEHYLHASSRPKLLKEVEQEVRCKLYIDTQCFSSLFAGSWWWHVRVGSRQEPPKKVVRRGLTCAFSAAVAQLVLLLAAPTRLSLLFEYLVHLDKLFRLQSTAVW